MRKLLRHNGNDIALSKIRYVDKHYRDMKLCKLVGTKVIGNHHLRTRGK
jgi:hypothetical protein